MKYSIFMIDEYGLWALIASFKNEGDRDECLDYLVDKYPNGRYEKGDTE